MTPAKSITLHMQPPRTTWQQHRVRAFGKRIIHYDSSTLVKVKREYESLLSEESPLIPYSGPLRIDILYAFGATSKHEAGEPKITRPDVDNMSKILIDCLMHTGYMDDDSQIYDLRLSKIWAGSKNEGYIKIDIYTQPTQKRKNQKRGKEL